MQSNLILQARQHSFWNTKSLLSSLALSEEANEVVMNIKQLIESYQEFYTPIYLCFVEYEKAIDNIKWQ